LLGHAGKRLAPLSENDNQAKERSRACAKAERHREQLGDLMEQFANEPVIRIDKEKS
jgi:hypothetical protein